MRQWQSSRGLLSKCLAVADNAARGMATACIGGSAASTSLSRSALFLRRLPLAYRFPSFPLLRPFSPIRAAARSLGVAGSRRRADKNPESGTRKSIFPEEDFVVASFYKFATIEDPEAVVAEHLDFLQERDIHGRIYINEQGINAQYSGPNGDVLAYTDWVKKDHRFSDLLVQVSPACDDHAFPRLKLRYKPSLVQMEGGTAHLPLVDDAMRAHPLTPSEWRERLQAMDDFGISTSKADSQGSVRKCLLLDVRNGYEWDIGHFQGAQRPNVECFRSTSFGLSNAEVASSDPLAKIDKENTDILMYCTGGIRCDVYSTILRQEGFRNLYTLSGGVSNYLKSEGSAGWIGNLFVFDARLSLPPSIYTAGASDSAFAKPELVHENSAFARCYVCGSKLLEYRHRNCANLDCNRLYLSVPADPTCLVSKITSASLDCEPSLFRSCSICVSRLSGCCCLDCSCAPRLRPLLPGHQRYQKWHMYRSCE